MKAEDINNYIRSLDNHNKELRKQISQLLLHKAKILTYVDSVQSNWRTEIEDIYKNIGIKYRAFYYINSGISIPFGIIRNPKGYELILYKEEKEVPTNSRIGKNVNTFIQFMKETDIEEVILTGKDHNNLISVYEEYLKHIEGFISAENDKELVSSVIESYIASELYDKLFSKSPSNKDNEFSEKLEELKYINPTRLCIPVESVTYEFWFTAIKGSWTV